MSSYHAEKKNDSTEFKRYHTFKRYPAAVSCWFPSGDQNHPIVTFFKFRDPDGEIITIKNILTQSYEQNYYFGASVVEFKCQIVYMNRKREVVLFYYPRELKWELTFIN